MNDTQLVRRFHVHDDYGLLRSFASKQEALQYMRGTDYFLITEKRLPRPRIDLNIAGEALI